MFIDASVIVAILKPEPDADSLIDALEAHGGPFYVSPLVRFEASISLARAKSVARPTATILAQAREAVTCFIDDIGAVEIPISPMIGAAALDAATAYGKTVGHPADLNFGDCFAYACAKTGGLRLLYKGQDFAQTDLA